MVKYFLKSMPELSTAKHFFSVFLLSATALSITDAHAFNSADARTDTLHETGTEVEFHEIDDPLEDFNRTMFSIHEVLDGLFLKPIAEIYDTVTHTYVQDRVHNVLQNLGTPSTFINDCLQGEGERAAQSLTRFTFNTTFGLLGLYDFAGDVAGVPGHQEDYGQTMAVHGVDAGPYLFIPILGPSTLRDLVGTVLDFTLDPVNYAFRRKGHSDLAYTRTIVDGVDQRTKLLPVTDRLSKTHDPYVNYKILYLQNRDFNINNGEIDRDTPTPDED